MKCPLLAHKTYIEDDWPMQVYEDCLKEECAWWDNTNDTCAILQLSKSLYYMGIHVAQAELKMPHAGQFRDR